MASRWRLRLLASLLLMAALASGCASPAPVGLPTAQVRVGTCKLITVGEEMVTLSDVSPAVPCADRHTYETYAIVAVPAAIRSWAERPQPELLQAQLNNVCPYVPVRPYLGAGPYDSQWGISIWEKAPTRAEWKRHVRRVVCDLVVDSSTPYTAPVSRGSLRDILRYSDSARLRQCRVGSPFVNVTCSRPHTGEKMGTIELDPKLKPGARPRAARAACRTRAGTYTGAAAVTGYQADYTVSPEGYVECWLNSTTGEVTGTQRGGLVQR